MRLVKMRVAQSFFSALLIVSAFGGGLLAESTPASAQAPPITPDERKLCIDVCFKQLTCAGHGSDRNALTQCTIGCEQALALRDPYTSKPWRSAAQCVSLPCGQSYAQCVTSKLSQPSPAERTCEPICRKRLECSGQGADINARQSCMRTCVVSLNGPPSSHRALEEATGKCLKKKCGVPLEACIATQLGGDNAVCAKTCARRLKCAKAETTQAFGQCMPSCLGERRDPIGRDRMSKELTCRGCGFKHEACIAKKMGGTYGACHRSCAKQLVC
ncbi:MAG: hypothetical protein ACI9OJ_001514, partial [Myxococcota bacterium]